MPPLLIGLCVGFFVGLILGLLVRHYALSAWMLWGHWRYRRYRRRELKKAGFTKIHMGKIVGRSERPMLVIDEEPQFRQRKGR